MILKDHIKGDMHILLTRPLQDSQELILRFKLLGHQVSHLPVINIEKEDYDEPNYNEFKGIIFTSSNAVKNLDVSKIDKKIICFVWEKQLKKM